MRINNNIMALNTHRQYSINNSNAAKSTEKLSSGYRINRAGDDAAGLAISEKMRAQIRGLDMASKNSNDAISLVQTAEGALTETHSILQRMRELATQSASDTNDDGVDRAALDAEFQALSDEIDDIASKTAFNGKKLLDGNFGTTAAIDGGDIVLSTEAAPTVFDSFSAEGFAAGTYTVTFTDDTAGAYNIDLDSSTAGVGTDVTITAGAVTEAGAQTISLDFGDGRKISLTMNSGATAASLDGQDLTFTVSGTAAKIQTGANMGDSLEIAISSMSAEDLGIADSVNISSQANASSAIDTVNDAINKVSTQRAKLGAYQNRLEHKINNLDTSSENLQAAESRIRDLDMAKEMTTYTKNNILTQAATAMLAQANQAPQNVLTLLR